MIFEKYFFSSGVRRSLFAWPRAMASPCTSRSNSKRNSAASSVVETSNSASRFSKSLRSASDPGSKIGGRGGGEPFPAAARALAAASSLVGRPIFGLLFPSSPPAVDEFGPPEFLKAGSPLTLPRPVPLLVAAPGIGAMGSFSDFGSIIIYPPRLNQSFDFLAGGGDFFFRF